MRVSDVMPCYNSLYQLCSLKCGYCLVGAEFQDDWRSYTEEEDNKVKILLRKYGETLKDNRDVCFKIPYIKLAGTQENIT